MNQVVLALKIAKKAHKNKFRHDGKTPYITHPIAIEKQVSPPIWIYYDKRGEQLQRSVALLHDVLEDSNITKEDLLKEGVDPYVVNVVEILTKNKFEPYLDYILTIKKNYMAKTIKIEDIKHNLSTLDPKNKTMKDKYELALYILEH